MNVIKYINDFKIYDFCIYGIKHIMQFNIYSLKKKKNLAN